MPTLYLTEQGSKLKRSGRRFIIEKDDEIIADIPLIKIERIFVFGHVQITTQALELAFNHEIPLAFFTKDGRLKGLLEPRKSKNVLLRVSQYRLATDKAYSTDTARLFIKSKILSQIKLINSFKKNNPEIDFSEELIGMSRNVEKLERKNSKKGMLGVEGVCTHYYFKAFRKMVKNSEFAFTKRSKRPPRDEVNSLLSYGYTILTTEYTYTLLSYGFDPYFGFLHEIYYGRPSLSLDLVEETRHLIIDRIVLNLINRKIIHKADFEQKGEGFFIKGEGKKHFFKYYEDSLSRIKQIITEQIENLRRAVENRKYYTIYNEK